MTDAGPSAADRQLVAAAVRKLSSGGRPTRAEAAALRRYEKEKEEKTRWTYYESIPQKHWRKMSGRQTKVLNEQAARYGIPFGGATVHLPAVVRALHDFLAENAPKLNRDEDPLLEAETASPALERYREERAALARLDRLEREAKLLPRDEVREGLGAIASLLRAAGEALERRCGAEAAEIFGEALAEAEHEIDRRFGEETA